MSKNEKAAPAIETARAVVAGRKKASKDLTAVCRAFLTLLGDVEARSTVLPRAPTNDLFSATLHLAPWCTPGVDSAHYRGNSSELEKSGGVLFEGRPDQWRGSEQSDFNGHVTLGVFGANGKRLVSTGGRVVRLQLLPGTPPALQPGHGPNRDS